MSVATTVSIAVYKGCDDPYPNGTHTESSPFDNPVEQGFSRTSNFTSLVGNSDK